MSTSYYKSNSAAFCSTCPVNSCNEWDRLEEVLIGSPNNAHFPAWELAVEATVPEHCLDFLRLNAGQPIPKEIVNRAQREVEQLARLFEAEGVTVRFGCELDHGQPFRTNAWSCESGFHAAMPRDSLLVVGNEIIEAPMAWRCRYFETRAYRPVLTDYAERGAKWTIAPRPVLHDDLYESTLRKGMYAVRNHEPTFDAADVIRCGDAFFVQRSHVTNAPGIEWLRTHLANRVTVEEIQVNDSKPMHIDATLMPLDLGDLLVNPDRVASLPAWFDGWRILPAPRPAPRDLNADPLFLSSAWLSMNVLSLGDRRIVVEERETELIAALKRWDFIPIALPFRAMNALGGSFHCAVLDIRRSTKAPKKEMTNA